MRPLTLRIQVFHDKYPFLGPALWILSIQYFILQPLVAAAWSQPFSVFHNTISDLANTACGQYAGRYVCSPLHILMNASFIILGFTMLTGASLLYHEFAKSRLSALGFIGMAVAGFGTMLVGTFPENTIPAMHVFGALLPFLIGNISIGLLGLALELPGWMKAYSILTSVLTLTALGLLISHIYLGIGQGGMERLVSYPQSLWLIIFGVYVSANRYRRIREAVRNS